MQNIQAAMQKPAGTMTQHSQWTAVSILSVRRWRRR
jgi:hypothetical protein